MAYNRKHNRLSYGGPPEGVRTPAQYCSTSGKVMFDKRGAVTAANARKREEGMHLRIYPCMDCNGWHLTKITHKRYNS